jgi:hypothetical protein
VRFDSIIAFYDPAVQFGFQFEASDAAAAGERAEAAAPKREDKTAAKSPPAGKSTAAQNQEGAPAGKTPRPAPDGDDEPDGGGEVVRLDRFRKK